MIVIIKGIRGLNTRENFIATAFEPLGKVMYVYGGGWNEADTGGGDANTLGLKKEWLDFSQKQSAAYNYKDYDYNIHRGLDCSAYVGWVIHNTLNDGLDYVTKSTEFGYCLQALDYGYVTQDMPQAGDLMFTKGHIYISLGLCADGSMLLLHSSPPGVQLSGTYGPNAQKNSIAVALSKKYMKKYYEEWYFRYPHNERDETYLDYKCFHWTILDNDFLCQGPELVLKRIFGE